MKITDYRIVISKNALFNERRAASFIRENVKLVCGKKLPFSERELIKNHIFKNYGLIPSP